MKRGVWHQFGDKSQKIALEQLENNLGVGVIISARDMKWEGVLNYAPQYKERGAHLMFDQQFYNPDFINENLITYPIHQFRKAISQMKQLSDFDLNEIANELRKYHVMTKADALIAPAVMYEAGRIDIIELNRKLFSISKKVGDQIGIPTYATVMLGESIAKTDFTLNNILSEITALNSDGWYFGLEFGGERIPSSTEMVLRCGSACLTLALTGKPVFHAFATPMALLSFGFGATATGIGHAQNLWQFTKGRWQISTQRGGDGSAPPRFFSKSLWGTIIYPDEIVQLSPQLRSKILHHQSLFSGQTLLNMNWKKWFAYKHLLSIICETVTEIAEESNNARANSYAAIKILEEAILLHKEIVDEGLIVKDNANNYQASWKSAVEKLLIKNESDYDLLELLNN